MRPMMATSVSGGTVRIELLLILLPAVTVADSQRLQVIATPPELELRPGARATLRMNAQEPPTLRASVGEVKAPRLVASGIYEATYVPPRESYPQVAIITATTKAGFGWVALPLAGTGELQVKTTPRGQATVRVGDRWFGPVRADSRGRAVVPIVVPPGTTHATFGDRRVKLEAPTPARPFAVLEPPTVDARARASVAVRVFVVTESGLPRRNAPLRVEASHGVLSAPREVEPGVFETSWDVPPASPGEASLSAWIAGEAGAAAQASLLRPASQEPDAQAIARAPPSTQATPAPVPVPRDAPVVTRPLPPAAAPPRTLPPPRTTTLPLPAPTPPPVALAPPPSAPARARVPPDRPGGVGRRPVVERTRFDEPASDVAIDLRSGAAWDRDGLRAVTAGMQVAWFPSPLGGHLGLALDGSGLAVREKERALVAGRNLELSSVARVFPVQGLALLRVPLLGGDLVAGAGGGSAYGVVRTAARAQPTEEVSGWATSLTAVLGYGHRAGPGSLFLEVRGQYVDAIGDQRVPGALELLGASLGYRIGL